MSREQYIHIIQKELQEVNKRIDIKILQGQEYTKEARDHKILRRKIMQHSRKSIFSKFFTFLPQF